MRNNTYSCGLSTWVIARTSVLSNLLCVKQNNTWREWRKTYVDIDRVRVKSQLFLMGINGVKLFKTWLIYIRIGWIWPHEEQWCNIFVSISISPRGTHVSRRPKYANTRTRRLRAVICFHSDTKPPPPRQHHGRQQKNNRWVTWTKQLLFLFFPFGLFYWMLGSLHPSFKPV